MSMREALRSIPQMVIDSWRSTEDESSKPRDIVDEYAHLVVMARVTRGLDRQSATWQFVSGWAAREILRARSQQDSCKDEIQAATIRERIRTLKELLSADDREKKKDIKIKDHQPDIP